MDSEKKSDNLNPVAILTAVVVVLAAGSYFCTPIHHPEFFQHLTFGRWISAHRSFPTTDLWTIAGHGKDWYLDSWLFAYSVSVVDAAFGNLGLIVLKLSAFLFFLSVSIVAFSRLSGSLFVGACLMLLVASGTLLDVAFGPEIFGWAFFILSCSLTYCFLRGEATRLSVCIFALVFVIYANLHCSFYLALLYCSLLVLSSAEVTRGRKALWLCLMLGAMFATPYLGAQAPSAIYGFINDALFRFVSQSDPSSVYHYAFSFLLILVVLLCFLLHSNSPALNSVEIILVVASVVAAFASHTYVPFAVVAVGLAIALVWGRGDDEVLGNFGLAVKKCKAKLSKISPLGFVWILFCILVINVERLRRLPLHTAAVPALAVDFILANDLEFPILHSTLEGPYLTYRLSNERAEPTHQALLDFRTSYINPDVARMELAYRKASFGKDDLFDFAQGKTVLCREFDPIYPVLHESSDWQLVFRNGVALGGGEGLVQAKELRVGGWAVFRKL